MKKIFRKIGDTSMDKNKVVLTGQIVHAFDAGPVTLINLMVNIAGKGIDNANFPSISVNKKMIKDFRKGDFVTIEGYIRSRQVKDLESRRGSVKKQNIVAESIQLAAVEPIAAEFGADFKGFIVGGVGAEIQQMNQVILVGECSNIKKIGTNILYFTVRSVTTMPSGVKAANEITVSYFTRNQEEDIKKLISFGKIYVLGNVQTKRKETENGIIYFENIVAKGFSCVE